MVHVRQLSQDQEIVYKFMSNMVIIIPLCRFKSKKTIINILFECKICNKQIMYISLHRVFHSIRLKVNKDWDRALSLFLFLKAFGALFRLTLQDVFDTQIGFGNEAGMYGRDRHQFHFPIQAWNTV